MQLNRSKNLAETMTGEASGPSSQWAQQDLSSGLSINGVSVWKNVNNNVSVQTGEEFSMEFLQDRATSRVVPSVHGVALNYEKRVGVPETQNRQICYEDLSRVLGLRRMDSECGSDVAEIASAKGSTTEIENGVYVNNDAIYCKDDGANGHVTRKSTGVVCNDQASSMQCTPVLTKSESSKSLGSSALNVSDCSQSGKVKFLCSFGGTVLPRPGDGKLRYVGGQTRIISIRKNLSWEELVKKTSGICTQPHSIKYQLPGEDLDALISVSSDEDLQNMIEEYYGVEKLEGSQRLRIFLIPLSESESSCTLDARSIQQNDPDYQYVVAVNGIVGVDPCPVKYYNGQPSAVEVSHSMPNVESNPIFKKSPTFLPHPLEMKDGHGVPNLTQVLNESQNLINFSNQSPSITPVPVQQGDLRNDNTTLYKNIASGGSTEGPILFSTAQLSPPPESSICYTVAYYPTPQLPINVTNSLDPIRKDDIMQPSVSSESIFQGDLVAPPGLERNISNFEQSCHDRAAMMGRTFHSEKLHSHPDNLMGILPGCNDSIGSYHGMPHAVSDSKLQEQGERSAYGSQEGMSLLSPLNFARPQLSSQKVPASLQEMPLQFQENIGLVGPQVQNNVLNVEPTLSNRVTELKFPLGLESLSRTESNHRQIDDTDETYQSTKEYLEKQSFLLKNHEIENGWSTEIMNKHDTSSQLLHNVENSCGSKSPLVAIESTENLQNVNSTAFLMGVNSPRQDAQLSNCVIPASSAMDSKPCIDSTMEQPQNNHLGKISSGVMRFKPESNTSWDKNLEVAKVIHNSRESLVASSLSEMLGGLSNGLVSPEAREHQPVAGPKDVGLEKPEVTVFEDLHNPTVADNAGRNMILHNSPLMQNPSKEAIYRREVSLLDEDLANYADQRIEKLNHFEFSSEQHKLQGTLLCKNKEQHQQETVPIIQYTSLNLSPAAESRSATVQDVADTVNAEILSPSAIEAESILKNSGSEEANSNGHKEELISDAMIAEMEADIYGLQTIKNADLEELRELGSGTYGTVYHGKWRGSDVAIKRIKKACFSGRSSEQERLTQDFWREARILSNLHHPNVVAFYGVVPDGAGGTLATVTEFMANGSLRNVLIKKDKSLDRRKKLIIAMDAAFGMEYLHSKNIVHFDLKCDNLLVNLRDSQRPICKVGDFGLSRIKRNTLVSGGVRGTLPWMAPELLNGSTSRVSEKVDVFSFGIALWEILTGEEPYANMHCGAIIGGIVKNTLRPTIPEKCDTEWRILMEQCWSATPEARPSFTEITNRLRSMSAALQAKGNINSVKQIKPNISM
ncbi:Protein kinase superfamily protein with octicosapeptide/Phox/Bem1p domain [Abeliophyllum distichum]|uniref:Protein kinase superfamily protein with octicosapeptide/Phox/Bem1p domain n=1 Tax=Abeliophyllum distichum TaxID=126358 RepID=A0ABD1VTT5_9LAMI